MNRRQKIIVSVTGIFLALLLLVGLTYAYFLTQVTGNNNDKSISVSTANLELLYDDNSEEIITGTGVLMPDSDNPIGTKSFTVTNKGNDSSYIVIIDNVSITKIDDGTSTSFVSNDFRYTLTCTKKDGAQCNEVNDLTIFPINGGILLNNEIKEDDVHSYFLTLWYVDTGLDQSDDMGKSLQARVNITSSKDTTNGVKNLYMTGISSIDNNSLAYNIINNAKTNKNGTKLLSEPESTPAEEISFSVGTGRKVEVELDLTTQSAWYYKSNQNSSWPWYAGGAPEGNTTICSDTIVNKYISYPMAGHDWYVKSCKNESIAIIEEVEEVEESEKTLLTVEDEYGTSYYFRGAVEDNYVNFAGMCWRIIRIQGDGSTKLILEDEFAECNDSETNVTPEIFTGNWGNTVGMQGLTSINDRAIQKNYTNPTTFGSLTMVKASYDFQMNKLNGFLNKLKSGGWCYSDDAYLTQTVDFATTNPLTLDEINANYLSTPVIPMYYDAYVRLIGNNNKKATLKCNGSVINEFEEVNNISSNIPMYVGAITADEVVFAGGVYNVNNNNYYLINNKKDANFYTFTPSNLSTADYFFEVNADGKLFSSMPTNYMIVGTKPTNRPVITLASSITLSGGEGIISNPYVVE